MDVKVIGKPGSPAVLWLAEAEESAVLQPLEKAYSLLLPVFSASDAVSDRAALLEEYILRDHGGRLWGLYGLREGGSLALELLARETISVRSAVVEGVTRLPDKLPAKTSLTRLHFWMGSRDKQAKKVCKALKAASSGLRSLTMKKLKAGQSFAEMRPDLLVKRLRKIYGQARILQRSTLIPSSRDRLWNFLTRHPSDPLESKLDATMPPKQNEADFTQVLEARRSRLSHWRHQIRLEETGDYETRCTDLLEISAGSFSGLAASAADLYLRRLQKQRKRQLRRE